MRGMLPTSQCRSLEAAMQSVRSSGMRLEWKWKSKSVGWVCAGFYEGEVRCELIPTESPLKGRILVKKIERPLAEADENIPAMYKNIFKFPIKENKEYFVYEFPLDQTPARDLFSNILESLNPIFDTFA